MRISLTAQPVQRFPWLCYCLCFLVDRFIILCSYFAVNKRKALDSLNGIIYALGKLQLQEGNILRAEEQLCIYLEGLVQGVGMRYYVNDLARKMGLRGYVVNTPDRRVKCVVQGEKTRLDLFINALNKAPRGRIDHVAVGKCTVWEELGDFNIRF
jgi:acylphosphatase